MIWAARFGRKDDFKRGYSIDERFGGGCPFSSKEEAEAYLKENFPADRTEFAAYLEPGGFVRDGGWYIVQPGLAACVGNTAQEAVEELLFYEKELSVPVRRGRRIWVFPGEVVSWDTGDIANCAFVRPTGPAKMWKGN